MRSKLIIHVIIPVSFLLTGCASITTGQNQTLSVETPGAHAAACELSSDKGKWFVPSTPGSVVVTRAYGDLNVTCKSKCGNKTGITTVKSSTKGMAFGNIILGGFIGTAVDMSTGSAYDYPQIIQVHLQDTQDKADTMNETAQITSK